MGKFPVFQSPQLDQAEENMRPAPDFLHGFLGTDKRKLIEILNEDDQAVKRLGLSHKDIAEALTLLTEQAMAGQGEPVSVEGKYTVSIQSFRGKLPCPFGHPGVFPKTRVELVRLDSGEKLAWSALSLHMIAAHGFYQGKGSPFRLDPAKAKEILDL